MLEKEGHPHTVYNIPRFKKPHVYHVPTIPPTSLTFQFYPFTTTGGKADSDGSGRNMLLFLETTMGRPLPNLQLNTSSYWVVPGSDGKSPDGAVALSRRIFLEGWLIQKLSIINRSTDVSAAAAIVGQDASGYFAGYDWTNDNDPHFDYNFRRATAATTANALTWEFNHNTLCGASDRHVEERVEGEPTKVHV